VRRVKDIEGPESMPAERFAEAEAAVARIEAIYHRNAGFLRDSFRAWLAGTLREGRVRATYPRIRFRRETHARVDSRLSYGFVAGPGLYQTTVTRPDLFRGYLTEQIALLLLNHGGKVEVGESDEAIPVHFAFGRDINVEAGDAASTPDRPLRDVFDTPDLSLMDDAIVNGTYQDRPGEPAPLALFRAGRIDYSLHRLLHYTGTDPVHFRNLVVFTNYQFYTDAFVRNGREQVASGAAGTVEFVEPGNVVTRRDGSGHVRTDGTPPERLPNMPAYHLKTEAGGGVTMINIGTGPSNARTITDHVAVLRPHAWLMLGHCAGLRTTARTTCSTRTCRPGCRSPPSPRCRWRCRRRWRK
jgi:AMP nucleosidase